MIPIQSKARLRGDAAGRSSYVDLVDSIFTIAETTARAQIGAGQAIPASAAGFLAIEVSGRTVAVPYFEI